MMNIENIRAGIPEMLAKKEDNFDTYVDFPVTWMIHQEGVGRHAENR